MNKLKNKLKKFICKLLDIPDTKTVYEYVSECTMLSSKLRMAHDELHRTIVEYYKIKKELDEYQNLDKNCKLVKLPCAIGTIVYFKSDNKVVQGIIDSITVDLTYTITINCAVRSNVFTRYHFNVGSINSLLFFDAVSANLKLANCEEEMYIDGSTFK